MVLSRAYSVGSAMLWLAYFMGRVILYALINWIPTLFKDVGIDAQTATLVIALFPARRRRRVLSGWLMDGSTPTAWS